MDEDHSVIQEINFVKLPEQKRRVRKVDWLKVMHELDQEPGEWALIGVLDRSVRSHIARGRYAYIDPALYEVTTTRLDSDGPRNLGYLFMRRRVEDSAKN